MRLEPVLSPLRVGFPRLELSKLAFMPGGAILPTGQILLPKSTPDEWGLKVLKLWNSALFGQESIGVLCIEMFWAIGTHTRIRSEPHLERACNPENTRETMLYPGKISERLRLVKK
jgi:hypothetical protein